MRILTIPAILLLGLALSTPVNADEQAYAELSKVLHSAVVDKVPREHVDLSRWGSTTPVVGGLLLPGLRKTVVVDGRYEWPHGTWRRARYWLDDPKQNLRLRVLDFRKDEGKPYFLRLEATLDVHAERERQQWQRGLQVLGATVLADATVAATFDCDVTVSVNLLKLPPDIKVTPKVTRTQLDLKTFDLRRAGAGLAGERISVGAAIEGEAAREMGNELKGLIGELIKQNEPKVTEMANQAIAKALAENKGKISAPNLMKAALKALPKEN